MPSIYDIKPKFQNLLRPLLSFLASRKITANKVTLTALILSGVFGAVSLLSINNINWLLIFPVWLFLRMALNAIDGMLAREYNMASDLGAVLNEVGDIISDFFLYIPFAFIHKEASFVIIVFTFGALLTEFCGVLGKALGGSRRYDGPMGKSDRAFFIGALALVTAFAPVVKDSWHWLFLLAFVLTLFTSLNRISKTLKEIGKK